MSERRSQRRISLRPSRSMVGLRAGHSATSRLAPGVVVGGRYRVTRHVATGGMGEVWAAEHVILGVEVALKTLLPGSGGRRELALRFAREALTLARVQSEHVVRIVDFVEDPTFGPVIVTDFVDGCQLFGVLRLSRLTVEQGIELGLQLCAALRDIHRAEIVHRDLKPGNVLLHPQRDGGTRVVIIDFGVSRVLPGDGEEPDESLTAITTDRMAVGTMDYMAPEQIVGSRDVRAAADLYSLGAILFRAVSGRMVFGALHGADLAHAKLTIRAPRLVTGRNDDVACAFTDIVARALERAPEQRYASAELMLSDVMQLRDRASSVGSELSGVGSKTVPDAPVVVGAGAGRRTRRTRAVEAAVALGLCLGVVAGTLLGRPAHSAADVAPAAAATPHNPAASVDPAQGPDVGAVAALEPDPSALSCAPSQSEAPELGSAPPEKPRRVAAPSPSASVEPARDKELLKAIAEAVAEDARRTTNARR